MLALANKQLVVLERLKGAFLVGEASVSARPGAPFIPCALVGSLLEAVAEAAKNATSGDVVLLSPARSSWDQFQDHQHRGEVLCQTVKSIGRGVHDGAPNIDGKTAKLDGKKQRKHSNGANRESCESCVRGFLRQNPGARRTKINQHLNRQTQQRHMKMNNQNPLIPQGSVLEQKNKGRARVKIAVFFVLAIHGIGLMALLMQGCGQSKEQSFTQEAVSTNPPPAFVEPTNPPVTTSTPPVVVTTPTVPETPSTAVVPAGVTEYTIVKGDILAKIAKNFHVSVKAITDANPGIEATKLKIGQKIHIPSPASPATPSAVGAPSAESASGAQIYTVKSGDNLTKIAGQYGINVKALRAANSLKTDSIKVGQKLKIPAKASAPVTVPTAPAEPVPAGGTSSPPSVPPGR